MITMLTIIMLPHSTSFSRFAEKLHRREEQLSRLLMYVKDSHGQELHGYTGHDVDHILQILEDHRHWDNLTDEIRNHGNGKNSTRLRDPNLERGDLPPDIQLNNKSQAAMDSSDTNPDTAAILGPGGGTHAHGEVADDNLLHTRRTSDSESRERESGSRDDWEPMMGDTRTVVDCKVCMHNEVFHASTHFHHVEHHEEHDSYHEVAHGLHFASIAIIGFLVLEVSRLKMTILLLHI